MTYRIYLWNPVTERPFRLFIHNVETEKEALDQAFILYPRHEFRSICPATEAETIK